MRIAFLLLVFSTIVISCKKKNGEPTPPIDTLSAFVNGTAFGRNDVAVIIRGSSAAGAREITIYARTWGGGPEIGLVMHDYNGSKSTFTLDRNFSYGYYCEPLNCAARYSLTSPSNHGEIKIVSFDKTSYKNGEVISGTFQFESDAFSGNINSFTDGNFSVFVPN